MSETILKPCPFGCAEHDASGDRNVILICQRDMRFDYAIGYGIRCNECGIEMWEEYEHEVTNRWNRRAAHADRDGVIEECRQLAFDQQSDDPTPGDWNSACLHIADEIASLKSTTEDSHSPPEERGEI